MTSLLPPASAVVAGLTSKADRIRALHQTGYSRAQIAEILGVRYQYVRNVLVDDERLGRRTAAPARGMSEAAHRFEAAPQTAQRVTVGEDGLVRIPPAMLSALGVTPGDAVLVRFDKDELRIYTPAVAGRRVQARYRGLVPEGVSLADELIAERREEAKREFGDD